MCRSASITLFAAKRFPMVVISYRPGETGVEVGHNYLDLALPVAPGSLGGLVCYGRPIDSTCGSAFKIYGSAAPMLSSCR